MNMNDNNDTIQMQMIKLRRRIAVLEGMIDNNTANNDVYTSYANLMIDWEKLESRIEGNSVMIVNCCFCFHLVFISYVFICCYFISSFNINN